MPLFRIALIGVVVVAMLPRAAAGQIQRDDPRTNARLRIGPFYVTPTFSIPELGIDTNVYNEQNEKDRDFTVTAVPAASIWLPIGRMLMFRTDASADFIYYQKFSQERAINGSVGVTGELRFSRMTVFGQVGYLNSRQRVSFEIDARARRQERRLRAGVEVQVLPKIWLEASAADSYVRFDADARFLGTPLHAQLDRDGLVYAGTARYRLTPLTTIGARVEAIEDRFLLAPIRSGDSMRYTAIVEFQPKALVTGQASVGVRKYRALNDETPDFSGTVADASLRYRPTSSIAVTARVLRDLEYSFEPLQPYYIVDGVGLSLRRAITGRFDVIGSWQRYKYTYRDLAGADVTGGREDLTQNYGVDLGYNVRRGARVGFGVSYWKRGSTTRAFRDYDGFRFASSVTYGF